MNAGNPTKERLADLGYRAIAPAEGMKSMLACLAAGAASGDAPGLSLIGLDARRDVQPGAQQRIGASCGQQLVSQPRPVLAAQELAQPPVSAGQPASFALPSATAASGVGRSG